MVSKEGNGNLNGDPHIEQLDSLAAASEFTRICKMLDERHMVSFSAGEDYQASGKRIYSENPTEQLRELILRHYAGTKTARERLLTTGFIMHGYNMGDVVSDTPFGSWPSELGMDVKNGNSGAFTREGAQRIEREDLLYWIPFGIDVTLDAARHYSESYEGEVREKMEAFLQQVNEYADLFGEPYDTFKESDSDHDNRAINKAAREKEKAIRFLESHPRLNEIPINNSL